MIFVLAPTFREANDWAREHADEYGLTACAGWKWIRDVHDLQGYRDARFVVLRGWKINPALIISVRHYLGEGKRL